MQDSFIFYKSYLEAIEKLTPDDQLKAFLAIARHSINEQEQQVDGFAELVYIMAKPQIEANNKRRSGGKKGGRPNKETSGFSESETIGYENEEPNKNGNSNVNENHNGNSNGNTPPFSPPEGEIGGDSHAQPSVNTGKNAKKDELNQIFTNKTTHFPNDLRKKVGEWITYKNEKGEKQKYKPTGLNALLTEIDNNRKKYGETAIIELITQCMANNWAGIIWEKLEKPNISGNKSPPGGEQHKSFSELVAERNLKETGGQST